MSRFNPPGQQFQPTQGRPGTIVQLLGTDLDAGENTVVKVGNEIATIRGTPQPGSIEIQIPDNATPGPQRISITFTIKSDDLFTVIPALPKPRFRSRPNRQFWPMEGDAGTEVILYGENFNVGAKPVVVLENVGVCDVGDDYTDTEIHVAIPEVPTPPPFFKEGAFVVTTLGGTTRSNDLFWHRGI